MLMTRGWIKSLEARKGGLVSVLTILLALALQAYAQDSSDETLSFSIKERAEPATSSNAIDETAKRFHVFPQIADGGGWQSALLVTNVAESESRCTFSLHGLPMDRFADISGVNVRGATATFDLERRGGYLVWSTNNELSVAAGYATLDCSAPVVAQVLYASKN